MSARRYLLLYDLYSYTSTLLRWRMLDEPEDSASMPQAADGVGETIRSKVGATAKSTADAASSETAASPTTAAAAAAASGSAVAMSPPKAHELEDVSDEAIQRRHEHALAEERKKFANYLKFPWSTGSRSNRRMDSRADSSGANTPDPTSPALPKIASVATASGGGYHEVGVDMYCQLYFGELLPDLVEQCNLSTYKLFENNRWRLYIIDIFDSVNKILTNLCFFNRF